MGIRRAKPATPFPWRPYYMPYTLHGVGFRWHPTTLAKLSGVEPHEVMQALRSDRRWPKPAAGPNGLLVMTIWARTRAGRRLIVVTYPDEGFDSWIVGARDMNPAEAAEYDRWEATQ